MDLSFIQAYYEARKSPMPVPDAAVLWAMSELGEAADELLKLRGPFVRNNPAKMAPFDPEAFLEELGDTIFILLVAGLPYGNAIEKMKDKIRRTSGVE